MFSNYFVDEQVLTSTTLNEEWSTTASVEDEDMDGSGTRYIRCSESVSSGHVKVYKRDIYGSWTEEGTLFPTDSLVAYGTKCAINSDGTIAVVSDPGYNSLNGALFVFSRSGSTWSFETRIDTNTSAAWQMGFKMLDISDDGTVIAASYGTDVVAYRQSGSPSSWSYEDKFGTEFAALSGDGNTICCRFASTVDGFYFYRYSGSPASWSLDSTEDGTDFYQSENQGYAYPVLNYDGTIMAWIPDSSTTGKSYEETGGTWGLQASFTLTSTGVNKYIRLQLSNDGTILTAFADGSATNTNKFDYCSYGGSPEAWSVDETITGDFVSDMATDKVGAMSGDGSAVGFRHELYSNKSEA